MTYVTRTDQGRVATLTMTQGGTLNALSDDMLLALQGEFDVLAQDDTIHAIILKGEGKVFCAGHNLREMQGARDAADGGAVAYHDLFTRCAHLMQTIRQQPQPVIAQVHGIATAAGCQLAATCDMVVSADNARFGVNGVNIGLFCSTPMVALTRAVPLKSAFEMLTTGRFLYAGEAKELGLVNRVVHADQLEEETMELAETVAGKLGAAVRIGKRAFYEQAAMAEPDAYAFAGRAMVENTLLDDTAEGIAAFLEKRKPDWNE